MAEQSEIKQILETVVKKVDGLSDDVRTNSYKLDKLEQSFAGLDEKVDRLEAKVDLVTSELSLLSGQFNDVGIMAIKDSGRIDDHEKRIVDLEANIH